MKERRITNRFDCSHLVQYSHRNDHSIGMVTDVSLDGARMSCQSPLEVGSSIRLLSLDSNGAARSVDCVVRWYRPVGPEGHQEAGLRFQEPVGEVLQSWVGTMLTRVESRPSHLVQRRREVRVPVDLEVLVGIEVPSVRAELLDLSESGALLRTQRMWPTGTELKLAISELDAALTAAVVSGRHAGDSWNYSLRFVELTPENRERLKRLVSRQLVAS
ncbi:MAG: PilZ domain-containing protein [Armatimonadetes bacterium]|nr:PilZ domain-containing protein [Armatimonadota bacterium]